MIDYSHAVPDKNGIYPNGSDFQRTYSEQWADNNSTATHTN